MSNKPEQQTNNQRLTQFEPTDLPTTCDYDAAALLLSMLDYDAQLIAIDQCIRMHRQAEEELQDEITKIGQIAERSSGLGCMAAESKWIDCLHHSVYQDAARSMAAIGMLAPFIESFFHQLFLALQEHKSRQIVSNHDRWSQIQKIEWDCHYFFDKRGSRRDLVQGILQLSDATGLGDFLPSDLKPTLQALFQYRNKMFHHGFEWPEEERERFHRTIEQNQWEDWFEWSKSGEQWWICYMKSSFVDHCLKIARSCIKGIGAYYYNREFPNRNRDGNGSS